MYFNPVMAKSSYYSSLQCHMILQKSFWYADLVLEKHFLLSVFCFAETVIHFQESSMNGMFRKTEFIWNRNVLQHYKCSFVSDKCLIFSRNQSVQFTKPVWMICSLTDLSRLLTAQRGQLSVNNDLNFSLFLTHN